MADAGRAVARTYYGQPVLKEPAWTWEVPWYLFSGGLAGASSALAAAARLAGHRRLADRARAVATAGAVASPVLLIKDLGRPRRFLNMLRVFKPTSAMSMGSWLLATYGTVAGAAAALRAVGRAPRLQGALDGTAGALGLPMTTYTAVLVADSSVPVWHEARHHLPWVFAGSAAASAGAAALLAGPSEEAGPARRLAVIGAATELAADRVMVESLGPVGRPYDEGAAGRHHRAATAATGAGAAMVLLGRRRPALSRLGAGLLLAGSALARWAVFRAGFQSAADPATLVAAQRQRSAQRTSRVASG